MSDAPLSPLVSVDLMPDILAGVNAILRENSSEVQDFIINNNSGDIVSDSSTMQNQDDVSTPPRPRRLPQLQLKLPVLSSSSSDSDGDDISRPHIGGDALPTDNGNRATSPPPNCAICLSRCKNKCFTDSCMHQFCFKCLCEWSKVKPECPLCKQTFTSIIHNVKSIDQFEEYHVQAPTVELPAPSFDLESFGLLSYGNRYVIVPPHLDIPRSRSSMVFTSDPSSSNSRSIGNSGNPFDTARVTRAYPIALLDDYYRRHPDSIGDEGISHLWRTYIYDRKLYALPVCDITGRFRESSARFYRDNPAQVHRLMPWIRRDIDCLVDGVLIQRDDVIQSIAEALTLMNILSSTFRRRIQPYLGTKTAHFIHELNNFARSPYDMIGYDRTVRYSPQIQEEIVIEFSLSESSDNEDNPTTVRRTRTAVGRTSTSTITSESQAVVNAINLSIHDRVNVAPNTRNIVRRSASNGGVIELGDESDNNNDPTASTSRQEVFQQQQQLQPPFQSFQGTNNEQYLLSRSPLITDNIELSSASSDCEFVLERKPPHLRTPEMVSLDSATDSDVVFVDEVKLLNKISFNTTDDEEEMVNNENDHAVDSILTSATTMGINDTSISGGGTDISGNPEVASSSSYRNKNKQPHHSQNSAAHHCQDMYNVGPSTSSGLRSTASTRAKRNSLVQHKMRNMRYNQSQRCLAHDSSTTGTKNETFGRLKRNESAHLDKSFISSESSATSTTSSSSSVSPIAPVSVTKMFPLSTTTDLSSSSGDEDFQPSFARKRRNNNKSSKQGGVGEKRHSPIKRNVRKRRMVKRKSRRSGGRIGIDDATSNSNNKRRSEPSTDDSESTDNESSDHVVENYALVMALGDKLKSEQKRKQTQMSRHETNKNEAPRRKRQRSVSVEQTDVENAWRSEAVNEPLKKKQRRQAISSYKMTQRQQETQSDVLNNQRNKLPTVVNVIGNCATNSNANNEQSTSSHSPKCRGTPKHQRKQDKQKQQQRQQSSLSETAIKREYISDEDDDDFDNLYLSVLKSLLKAEQSTSLSGDTNQPSTEMDNCNVEENVNHNTDNVNHNTAVDEVDRQPMAHQENESLPPSYSPSSLLETPLQTLFQDNDRDESNSTNTTASSVPTMIGDIEMPRPGINNGDELVLNSQCLQLELAGSERIVAPILNTNTVSTTTPQLATVTSGSLQTPNINVISNDVHISVDDSNINPIRDNNIGSTDNTTSIVRNNNREFSALSLSPSTSSLLSSSSSSTAFEEECPIDRLLETNYLEDFRNRLYGNDDRNNDHHQNNDDNEGRNDDDDDNHSNSSTISTGSISSTTTTDTASDTTENDLHGVFH